MKKIFFILAWILLSVGTIMVGAGSYLLLKDAHHRPLAFVDLSSNQLAAAEKANSPLGEVKGIETSAEAQDARPQIVENFLRRYNSPLEPYDYYGKKLVEIADKYEIDFRFLPAIAMQESNLCKKAPEGTHNCLGFGIHKRGTLGFESYEAAFDRAGKELKANYIDQGRTTPEQIMHKYTPSSKGSWAASVTQWMNEMKYDDHKKGKEADEDVSVVEFTSAASVSGELN
jgi:hypothetical protein